MRIAVLLLSFSLGLQGFRKTYTDEKQGFSIPIPNGWTVTAPTKAEPRLIMKAPARDRSGGTLILQVSPAQKAVVNGTVTLDRYLEEVKKQYPSRFEDFEWVKTEKGKQGENLTLALTYKYSTSGQTVEQLQFLVWTEDHHYSLSWGCLASRFQQNRKLFEKVSGAFKPDEKK